MMMKDCREYATKCFRDEAQAILDMIPRLTDDFTKAVDLIYNCKGRLIVTGVGKSGHIGRKIAATFASTGTPSFYVNPLDAYHGDLGMITPDDIVLAISYSGNTDELMRFIPLLLDREIPIIGVSGNRESILAKYSACFLDVSVEREADPLNLAPTTSTTATLAMGDALACALIEVRDFKPSDFARFHPGGSLGKRLLFRVKDFMITSNLPVVSLDCKVSDTVIEICKAKQGLAVAMDGRRIAGVVTDGDVRRAMRDRQERFFSLTVREIMTDSPKIINENAKIVEAGELMKRFNIHSLPVVNDADEFVGLIDSLSCM